jgi:hypothetical protein
MPVRNLVVSVNDPDLVIEPSAGNGIVWIDIHDLSDPIGEKSNPARIAVSADDVPTLCAELRRVAKLAKQGGGNGAG